MAAAAPAILVLSGPPGVGKSTVARLIRDRVPGSVAIEGDALRRFAPTDARSWLGGGSTYRAAAVLAGSYLRFGATAVLFDYVFCNPGHVRHFSAALPPGAAFSLFTLWAPLDVVLAREAARVGREPLADAVRECHAEIATNLGRLGRVVDATAEAGAVATAIQALTGGR